MWYWLLVSSHSIWAKSDLFPTNLAHLSPKGTAASLITTRKQPCKSPFFTSHCNVPVSRGGTCPKAREQNHWALPLPLMWVSSVQTEKGRKGAQRLPEGDSSCIMQRLLSITRLGTDLLPSRFPIGKHSTYDTRTNDWTWSTLATISKHQVSNSTSTTVKYFYNLYWSRIPGWFLLCTEKVKQDASRGK